MERNYEIKGPRTSNYIGMITLSPDIGIIISAIAQLERDLIAERVRNGLAAAKARGAKIGRERKRNSALIESLLEAGLSFREIARIASCSHGSVSAQKKEWLARKKEKPLEISHMIIVPEKDVSNEKVDQIEPINSKAQQSAGQIIEVKHKEVNT